MPAPFPQSAEGRRRQKPAAPLPIWMEILSAACVAAAADRFGWVSRV
ncbi:hypothetical protein HMPREF0262_01319 [Clostridium sp. ATCC 29733]|nr:hypothetical protein HMPREF0262_01319 [Clostridium sp. ATCC 29733]